MSRRRAMPTRVAAAALLTALALAGCGQGGVAGGTGTTTDSSTGSASSRNPSTDLTEGTGTTSGPIDVTGTVEAGVEAGCVLVDGYLLLGGPPDVLVPGQEVAVVGKPAPDAVTTCMEGTPLEVVSARLI